MHSEIQQLGQETDKDFVTVKDTRCYAVASTITTIPTVPLHCYEIISTIAVSRTGTPTTWPSASPTIEVRPTCTCTTGSHTTDTQPNKTTDANASPTGKLGIGDAAFEFRQTNLATGLLGSIVVLVVINWLILSHRRVNLERRNHREEMSIKRLEIYSKSHPQTSAGIKSPDEDLLRAGISPYTLYESRMPQWSFAKLRLWWGSTGRIESEAEIERLKAETARIRAHGLRLEVELEVVKRHATWGPRGWVPYKGRSMSM